MGLNAKLKKLVENPPHYNRSKIETIEAIEAWGLPFHLANAIKYISRAGFKKGASLELDLNKAIWYIERYISIQKGENIKPANQRKGGHMAKAKKKVAKKKTTKKATRKVAKKKTAKKAKKKTAKKKSTKKATKRKTNKKK